MHEADIQRGANMKDILAPVRDRHRQVFNLGQESLAVHLAIVFLQILL